MATVTPRADLMEPPAPSIAPTPTPTPPPSPAAEPGQPQLYRMSLDTYRQVGESGAITREARVVLLDGLLVKKMTKGPLHTLAANATMMTLLGHIPAGYHLKVEAPVELQRGPEGDDSAPEPDVTVIRGVRTDYRTRLAVAADVLLVVEIADSLLRLDRRGLRRYAWAGIPTTWIVNIRAGAVEVYTGPSGPVEDPTYSSKITRTIGEMVALALNGGQVVEGVAVANLFE